MEPYMIVFVSKAGTLRSIEEARPDGLGQFGRLNCNCRMVFAAVLRSLRLGGGAGCANLRQLSLIGGL